MSITYASPTFRLFKKRSGFADGLSALLDMSSQAKRYNQSETPNQADLEAFRADWQAIGQDFRETVDEYDRESKTRKS